MMALALWLELTAADLSAYEGEGAADGRQEECFDARVTDEDTCVRWLEERQ